ncbi:hypothetical protein [uncultured Lutibacter sp.]|uniref:hypothetical protein n=1 Tax=uncultured Lutibacter sp. TaxID=437739 RepID=UPI002639192C|nr:hypothetical protein [uncultured Lutibacter sp.]
MKNEKDIIKKSLCLENNHYRFFNGERLTYWYRANLEEVNKVKRKDTEPKFYYYPHKPYWFYLLKRRIIELKEYINVNIAKNKHFHSVVKWIFAIIGVIASVLYIIEFNKK